MPKCISPTAYGRCRKCEPCLATRLRSWLLRMILEAMLYDDDQVTFCTFTYAPAFLPESEDIAKHQLQKFFKRLRKSFNLSTHVRYVAALEKGTQGTKRFHWHAILYGLRFTSVNKHFLSNAWGQGFIEWKPATAGRMAYVLKYVIKGGKFLMSRRPGLGAGMIYSINLSLSKLSQEERYKLADARERSYLANKFMIEKFGTENWEVQKVKPIFGREYLKRANTIQSLRIGGFYYPLHDYIKRRLLNLRLQHEQEQIKEKKS